MWSFNLGPSNESELVAVLAYCTSGNPSFMVKERGSYWHLSSPPHEASHHVEDIICLGSVSVPVSNESLRRL